LGITVTRARVKDKCAISVTTYDTTIDNLIAEMGAAVTYALKPEYVGGGLDANLQATLDLGATEIVCGELMAQLCREPGATEAIALGTIQIWSIKRGSINDPYLLIEAGWTRLRPFLRLDANVPTYSRILSNTDKVNGELE
jgi:hypothetical protein